MLEIKQTETFRKWRMRLKDGRARGLIASRLDRLAFGHAGDVEFIGQGINELRIHHGPGYRIYFEKKGNMIIVLLCGGDKSTQAKDIKAAKQQSIWPPNGVNKMTEKLTTYDPAEDLSSEEGMAAFMAEAFETNDVAYIAHALGVIARAKGMAQIAGQTGLSREQLYRSFSANGNPTLKTTLAVMKAVGIVLSAKVHA